MKKISIVTLSLLMPLLICCQTVTTQFGTIQGNMNGSVLEFLGIPFASPPVGNLRWNAPQDPASWTGTLNTQAFAPVCAQKNFQQGSTSYTLEGDEDCLYLNVWTPQTTTPNLPVMVFIHGGGNQQGGASETGAGTQMYVGKNMAERGNAVIVTIQYRLGPLGFLVHPGLEPENANNVSGNYAVMDQLLALKWVKNNISNFGGDTTKILVFGESAGGVNTGNLLNTPAAAGLFTRACIESAAPSLSDYTSQRNNGISFVDSFTTTGTDVQKIAYMRTLSADSLLKYETSPLAGGVVGMNWRAVVDNQLFYNTPYYNAQSGNFNHVPLMIGTNADEMSLSAPPTVTPAMVTALINLYVPLALRPTANTLYPPGSNNTDARKSYVGILTDAQFTVNARRTAQCISLHQSEPVWRYLFSFQHTVPALATYGSYHGMELFYIFNNWENATLGSGSFFHAADDSVQNLMLQYWVNFANSGDPNGSGLVNWPQFDAANDCFIELKATPNGSQCGLRTAESNLWDQCINYVPCWSTAGVEEAGGETIGYEIYPNPTTGIVSIKNSDPSAEIKVFDVLGNQLLNVKGTNTIDISGFEDGVYSLVISGKEKQQRFKIVKAR